MDKQENIAMRVHKNFYDRVTEFIKEFKKIHGISISTTSATKIIDDKINQIGGLIVD
jgi:hypothetical protein